MLKSYKYQQHSIEDLHPLIMDAFVIIGNAKAGDVFDINLFSPDLQELMNYEKENEADLLYKPLENIFNAIKVQDDDFKKKLLAGVKDNNRIEELCENPALEPLLYRDLPEDITKLLKPFFNSLYEKLIGRAYFIKKYKGLKDHFNQLMRDSNMLVCPFCGVTDMNSEFDDGRDAYDHYLPKGTFPFSSVNFANLVPMCNECNSRYKLEKTLIFQDLRGKDKTKRSKAFYPYKMPAAGIKIRFSSADNKPLPSLQKIEPKQLTIELACTEPDKIESWIKVFRIDKRYKAKSCQFFKSWFYSFLQEYWQIQKVVPSITWEDFFKIKLDISSEEMLKDKNMIRVALFTYLKEECGLIDFLKSQPSIQT